MPLHNLQPAQLQEWPLVEMNKLAAKEYDELNSTFLQISNVKKVPRPIWKLIFLK